MPELVEQMYCSQQIVIPPSFPYILKRYCKAAIKTQPYDVLRWSFEYFKALANNHPPPVKLRLEYPIYNTEGGLTRGCLKVLAQQLSPMAEIPLPVVKAAWQSFCLDPMELRRIFCLCEVHMRAEMVPFLHFIAVAGGMLTKCLTHTMILLCESLTKEPDGGSAAIPIDDFLKMYTFLAVMDASHDVQYHNGVREGVQPEPKVEERVEEEERVPQNFHTIISESDSDDYWEDQEFQRLTLIDDNVSRTARLSIKMNMPIIGNIERSPSIERRRNIERENYYLERSGRARPSDEVEKKLRELTSQKRSSMVKEDSEDTGEPEEEVEETANIVTGEQYAQSVTKEDAEASKAMKFVAQVQNDREDRQQMVFHLYEEIEAIVDRFKSANYDLGMIAGRQMSTTSGEFIAQHIQREIMDYVNDQIAILPDPDLNKKKAKPAEVAMIKDMIEDVFEETMDIIAPESEVSEEEDQTIPEVTLVYAVPGIGAPVEEDIYRTFEEYILDVSRVQADLAMPRNIRHFLCPPLEPFVEHNYKEFEQKEAANIAG